jgi:hypothetical protein
MSDRRHILREIFRYYHSQYFKGTSALTILVWVIYGTFFTAEILERQNLIGHFAKENVSGLTVAMPRNLPR